MQIFEIEGMYLFPLFFDWISGNMDKRFSYCSLTETTALSIVAEIRKRNKNSIFVIDMQFIDVIADSRCKPLEMLRELSSMYKIILVNIQKTPDILSLAENQMGGSKKYYYDIHSLEELQAEDHEAGCVNSAALIIPNTWGGLCGASIIKKVRLIYKTYIMRQISHYCVDDSIQYLPSSDIYSNKYVRIKDLFVHSDLLALSIYMLAKLVRDRFGNTRFDALISASNTGAVLANLLGITLSKDVVFCSNVGPQFALDITGINEKIKPGEKYLCVFDFLCLGTEVKNLKSIIACMDAELIGGVGIASYIDLDALRSKQSPTQESKSMLRNVYSLFSTREAQIPYQISTEISTLR